MKVKVVADILGVTPDTVRYYSRIGFVNPEKNKVNGYKEYSKADCARLRFILCARRLGFTVIDIGEILGVADKGKTPCPMVRKLIQQRFDQIEDHFNETVNLHNRMKAAIEEWKDLPDMQPTGHMICHLIESIA